MIISHTPLGEGKREYRFDEKLDALVLFIESFPDDIVWIIAKLGSADINGKILTRDIAIKTAQEWNKEIRQTNKEPS